MKKKEKEEIVESAAVVIGTLIANKKNAIDCQKIKELR